MDKYPLLLDGRPEGELSVDREGLYTVFSARCPLAEGLWCAWAVGDQGELRLGVLEPEGRQGSIRRRFSRQLTAPLGRILRGELRPAGVREARPGRMLLSRSGCSAGSGCASACGAPGGR